MGLDDELVYGNEQGPEIIEKFQQRVEATAAKPLPLWNFRIFLRFLAHMLRRAEAYIYVQGQHFQHLLSKGSSILSCSYFCCNKQCGIVVARTKHPSE